MWCRVAGVCGRRRVDGVIWCLGASGGELEAGGAAVSRAVSSCFYAAAHLSDGMSITLNVGAGVAASAGASASARSTARGARTWHCGAKRAAELAKHSAATILCIVSRIVLAIRARTSSC